MLLVAVLAVSLCETVVFVASPLVAHADAATGTAGQFVPVAGRLLDTRAASSVGGYSTPMPANVTRAVNAAGVAGIPSSGVSAIAVTLSVVGAGATGAISIAPGDVEPVPTAPSLNFNATDSVANTAMVAVHANGKINVRAVNATVNLIIDVQGYYTAGDSVAEGGFVPVSGTRIVNTVSGVGAPLAKVATNASITVQATGVGGVPASAGSVFVNITAFNQAANGFIRVYPTGTAVPTVGALGFDSGYPMGLGTTAVLDSSGRFNILVGAGGPIDLIVDVQGYFDASVDSGAFTPAAVHLYDSRISPEVVLAGNSVRTLPVAGLKGIPLATSGIGAVVLNVRTVLNAATTVRGYLRMWPADKTEPATTTMNYDLDQTYRTNMSIIAPSVDGYINIRNAGTSPIDIVVDIEGWFANALGAVPSGQYQTQQSITLQGSKVGSTSYAAYKYRVGTSAAFVNIPVGDLKDSSVNSPSSWPVTKTGGAFTAYAWNIRQTLVNATGTAPDSLVQVQACYDVSSSFTNPVCAMPDNIEFSQSGLGAATEEVGQGTLALLTGDYNIASSDASAASSLGGLSVGRSLTTLTPVDAGVAPNSQRTDASGVFGPAWTADFMGPYAGYPELNVTDNAASGYIVFNASDGTSYTFQTTTPVNAYPISFAGAGGDAADSFTVTKVSASIITLADPSGTITTWTKPGATWRATSVAEPGSNSTTTYSYNTSGLVTRILAPVPSGLSCNSAPDTTVGCRSLTITYQPITVSGVALSRVEKLSASLPQTAGTANILDIEKYDYDSSAQLIDAYDPRITANLKTGYTYDGAGRLASLTPAGQAAMTFGYDTSGRLSTVSRADPSGSTAVMTIVYSLVIAGSSAPVALDAATTGTWSEVGDLPVTGTAIFRPDHQPAGTTFATVAGSDWPYATLHYLDVNGLEVNTAQYGAGGWLIGTTQYDSVGNDTWSLSPGNRAQALSPTISTDSYVSGLATGAIRATALASTKHYNPLDPAQLLESFGPTHPVRLDNGATIHGQSHTRLAYDEGAPNNGIDPTIGAAYGLVTTTIEDSVNTATASPTSYPDAHTTLTGHDAFIAGDPSGWYLHEPTWTTVQMGASPSSADLVTKTRYDVAGRVIETRLPGDSSGTTPRTTLSVYYTAGVSGTCVSSKWAGLSCSNSPAAQPSAGSPLAVTSFTYDQYGNPVTTTERYGSGGSQVVRTKTLTSDAAERPLTRAVAVAPTSAGGAAVPTVTYGYDSATGLQTTESTGAGASLVTLTTTFNNIGQPTGYTDAGGATSIMQYDVDGRPISLNDGQGTTTYAYDSSTEHRGVITSQDVGVAGSPSIFTASYDAAGLLTAATYPNGLIAVRTADNADQLTSLRYSKSGSTWMTFTQDFDEAGRVTTAEGPQSTQNYSYDGDSRLSSVQDTYSSACSTRAYTFDTDSNRTNVQAYPAGVAGICSTSTTPTTTTTTYDQADRNTNTGYTYDALGRTLTVPPADAQGIGTHAATSGTMTLSYYSNDMLASQNQASTATTFTLDPLQNRIANYTDGGVSTTNHYAFGGDSPSWSATGSALARNLSGLGGGLVATADQSGVVTLLLPNLHGDIVATCADNSSVSGPATYSETTEYGTPRSTTTALSPYGWLGTTQRNNNALGGTMLMGLRLYNTATGRFLSTDSVPGGTANAYSYVTDPVNDSDLSGMCADKSSACVIKVLTTGEPYPPGFIGWLKSKGQSTRGGFHRSNDPFRRMENGGDHCSMPWYGHIALPGNANHGFNYDFTDACDTHDLGYDLMRFMNQRDHTNWTGAKAAVDQNFRGDLYRDCSHRNLLVRGSCQSRAFQYYQAVNLFGHL